MADRAEAALALLAHHTNLVASSATATKVSAPEADAAYRCPPGTPDQHTSLGVLYELVC